MTTNSPKDFEDFILSIPETPFVSPQVTFDKDGDCIEFLTSNDDFYGERVDGMLTVYYKRGTNEIVGTLIKGVTKHIKRVLEKFPGFAVEIHDGKMSLTHFFTAQMWTAPDQMKGAKVIVYEKLRAEAERTNAQAEVGHLVG